MQHAHLPEMLETDGLRICVFFFFFFFCVFCEQQCLGVVTSMCHAHTRNEVWSHPRILSTALPTMQVHQARLILQPSAAATDAVERLFETCHAKVCVRVATQHHQANVSGREAAVVAALQHCVCNSQAAVEVRGLHQTCS